MTRHRSFVGLVVGVVLGLAGPSGAATKLTVGHDLWIGYSGVFVAKDRGFFTNRGLDVQFKSFSNPGDTLPALAAGKLDVGLTTLHNLALLTGTADADMVAVYLIDSSNGADAVVAKKEIASVADLKGHSVAATLGEVNHMLLMTALESAGLKESDIKLVDMSADDGGAAFVAGKVDAAVTWEPWVTKATNGGGHVVFSSAQIPDTILDSVVVPRTALTSRAQVLRDFVAAIDEGVQFVRAHPEQAAPLIAKRLNVPPAEVSGMLAGDKVYDLADNRRLLAADGAGFRSMQRVIDFVTTRQLVKKPLAPATLLVPHFPAEAPAAPATP